MISFCRVWYLVIWYASRLTIASSLSNPFNDQKYKSQNRDTLKSPWLIPWSTLNKIAHFSEILLSHDPLFGQKWPKQSWAKRPTFQNNPHIKKRCFNLGGHLWHVSLPGVEKSKKKRKRKIDCHVMHLKNSSWV